jgi:hypothetical protein
VCRCIEEQQRAEMCGQSRRLPSKIQLSSAKHIPFHSAPHSPLPSPLQEQPPKPRKKRRVYRPRNQHPPRNPQLQVPKILCPKHILQRDSSLSPSHQRLEEMPSRDSTVGKQLPNMRAEPAELRNSCGEDSALLEQHWEVAGEGPGPLEQAVGEPGHGVMIPVSLRGGWYEMR